MTTRHDRGSDAPPPMLFCPVHSNHLYQRLELALRDMREAHGRNLETGAGVGSRSWIGLSLGMIVLDTLAGNGSTDWERWERLLTTHGVDLDDAFIIYKFRNSLLHGYGIPKVSGTRVYATGDHDAYALGTDTPRKAVLSVPVFCGRLVERIAYVGRAHWDTSLIDANALN